MIPATAADEALLTSARDVERWVRDPGGITNERARELTESTLKNLDAAVAKHRGERPPPAPDLTPPPPPEEPAPTPAEAPVEPPPPVAAAARSREVIRMVDQALGYLQRADDTEMDAAELNAADPKSESKRLALNVAAAWTMSERTKFDLNARRELVMIEDKLTDEDRMLVGYYSGLGGLSFARAKPLLPDGWVPDSRGLLDEYYTPRSVATEVVRVALSLVSNNTPRVDGKILVLEPSAGVGRFVSAMVAQETPDLPLNIMAVDIAAVSARMCKARYPRVTQYVQPFEAWVRDNEDRVAGKIGLVVSNPPYPREVRANRTDDPKYPLYEEKFAARYFLRRAADLVGREGVSAFYVPAGTMSSKSKKAREVRQKILLRHHLAAAFRPPSNLFPGAHLVCDLIFLVSRGGALKAVPDGDAYVLNGDYYKKHPEHILGTEVHPPDAKEDDEDEESDSDRSEAVKRKRYRYKIEGAWQGIPPFVPRALDRANLAAERPADAGEAKGGKGKKGKKPPAIGSGTRGALKPAVTDLVRMTEPERRASLIGASVDHYFSLAAAATTDEHVKMWPELVSALQGWVVAFGNPHESEDLVSLREANEPAILRFLQAYNRDGTVIAGLLAKPSFEELYGGDPADLCGVARWLRSRRRAFTIDELAARVAKVAKLDEATAVARVEAALPSLIADGWRLAGDNLRLLETRDDYVTGHLWPKHDALAAVLRDPGDPALRGVGRLHGSVPLDVLKAHLTEILNAIGPMTYDEITEEATLPDDPLAVTTDSLLRQGWIPLELIHEWIVDGRESGGLAVQIPPLEMVNNVITIEGYEYADLREAIGDKRMVFNPKFSMKPDHPSFAVIGYLNADYGLFRPSVTDDEDLALVRRMMAGRFEALFRAWVAQDEKRQARIVELYNRMVRGFKPREYTDEPVELLRWNKAPGAPVPAPHQNYATRKFTDENGGLLAFDVGVGKTFTGCMIIAKLRQEGRARRPVVLVPNPIVWQWYSEMKGTGNKPGVLPDYNIVVIGQEREVILKGIRAGEYHSDRDGVEAQGQKWQRFAAGEFDVALLVYSALENLMMDEDSVVAYVQTRVDMQRQIELQAQRHFRDVAQAKATEEQQKNPRAKVKRQKAERDEEKVRQNFIAFVKGILNPTVTVTRGGDEDEEDEEENEDGDEGEAGEGNAKVTARKRIEGILWEQVGVDCLVVDEAQNFKNLYKPLPMEDGSVPKYMGNAGKGSKRAWQLDFRIAAVRRISGGGGVFLLSATPAKNTPVEFYTMLQYVDPAVWTAVGVRSVAQFVDRYIMLTRGDVSKDDGTIVEAWRCVGFKNLHEIRAPLARLAIFRTAEEAKLKLPQVDTGFADGEGGVFSSKVDDEGKAHYFTSAGAEIPVEQVGIPMTKEQFSLQSRFWEDLGDKKYAMFARSMMGLVSHHIDLPGKFIPMTEKEFIEAQKAIEKAKLKGGKKNKKETDRSFWVERKAPGGTRYWERIPYEWKTAQEVIDRGEHASPKYKAVAAAIINNITCGQVVIARPEMLDDAANALVELGTSRSRVGIVRKAGDGALEKFAHGRPAKKGEYEVIVTTRAVFDASGLVDKACGVHDVTVFEDDDGWKAVMKAAGKHVLVARTCAHIIFHDWVPGQRWLRQTLIDAGVPAERIAVLNAVVAKAPSLRTEIAAKFNGDPENGKEPVFDIIIGNKIAEEGMNLQGRTCAIHHVDLPWEPASLQQRNGRGVRQGNIRKVIKIRYYFSRRSLDAVRFGLIAGKRGWMVSLLKSQDRVTNNPGAAMMLSSDDEFIITAPNPQAARIRLEERRIEREQQRILAERKAAANIIRTANTKFRRAERLSAEGRHPEALVDRTLAEDFMRRLSQISADAYPYVALVDRVIRDRNVWALEDGLPPLFEGLRVKIADVAGGAPRFIEFGRPEGMYWYSRNSGDPVMFPFKISDAGALFKGNIVGMPEDWPVEQDNRSVIAHCNQYGRNSYVSIRNLYVQGDVFDRLKIHMAPTEWLVNMWPTIGPNLVRGFFGDYNAPPKWMFIRGPKGIELVRADERRFGYDQLVPPHVGGWQEVAAALPLMDDTVAGWKELNKAAEGYFGRSLPTGTLGADRPENKPIDWSADSPLGVLETAALADRRFRTKFVDYIGEDRKERLKGGFYKREGGDLYDFAQTFDARTRTPRDPSEPVPLHRVSNYAALVMRDRMALPAGSAALLALFQPAEGAEGAPTPAAVVGAPAGALDASPQPPAAPPPAPPSP